MGGAAAGIAFARKNRRFCRWHALLAPWCCSCKQAQVRLCALDQRFVASFASALLLAADVGAAPPLPPETTMPVARQSLVEATVSAAASGLIPEQDAAKKAAEKLGEEASRELKSQVEAEKKKIEE